MTINHKLWEIIYLYQCHINCYKFTCFNKSNDIFTFLYIDLILLKTILKRTNEFFLRLFHALTIMNSSNQPQHLLFYWFSCPTVATINYWIMKSANLHLSNKLKRQRNWRNVRELAFFEFLRIVCTFEEKKCVKWRV